MTVTLTRNGDRLYVGRSLAFLARRHYVNAWGRSNVEGRTVLAGHIGPAA
jgi:hypothetical protein